MIHIAYDINSLTESPFGGIAQVVYNTLLLAKNHPDISPEGFFKTGNVEHIDIEEIVLRKLSPIEKLIGETYDIAHSLGHRKLRVKAKKSVYTIYDTWSFSPNKYQSPVFQKRVGKRLRKDVKKADHIVTISETTRKNLLALDLVKPKKCTTVHLGVNVPPNEYYSSESSSLDSILKKRYILFVGCLEIRKNIGHVLDAVLPLKNVDMVIVGQPGYGYEEQIKDKITGFPHERMHLFYKVNRGELGLLYKKAVASLLPSWEEGFGLPILEAMTHACPVITSNCSASAEIGGDSAILVNPGIPEQSQQAIQRLLDDNQYRHEIIEKGLKRVKLFSWDKYYTKLVDLYKTILY